MIRWGSPAILHLFWLFVPLALWLIHRTARRARLLAQLAHPEHLPTLAPDHLPQRRQRALACRLFALACCLLALARPQWGFHWEDITRHGLDIMVVFDTSRSMLAEDIPPSRIQQAKWGVHDLVQRLRGDRIGLVAFAGAAHIQCPLTSDYGAFLMALNDLHVGIIPRGGTAIGLGLEKAIEAFDATESLADKVIILISDGEDNHRDPARWLSALQARNIRVYAIGIGTPEGELIPITRDGIPDYVKDAEGQVIQSRLDEQTLQRLALETGGIYVRAGPGDYGLDQIYDRSISQLARDDHETRRRKIYEDRFIWFLLLACLALLLEAATGGRPLLARKRATASLSALLLLLAAPARLQADETARQPMTEALALYNEAETLAAALLEDTPEPAPDDPRIETMADLYRQAADLFQAAATLAARDDLLDPAHAHHNLGNAHYRLGDYPAAHQAYKKALATTDIALQARTYHNLGNNALKQYTIEPPGQFEQHIEHLESCLAFYEQALLLDPSMHDARTNHEIVQARIHSLLYARDTIGLLHGQITGMVRAGHLGEAARTLEQMMNRPELHQIMHTIPGTGEQLHTLRERIGRVVKIDQRVEKLLQTTLRNDPPEEPGEAP